MCDLLTLCCFSNFSIYILKFLYFQLEMHSLQWKKILRGKGATKLKQMKILIWPGVEESSKRGRPGRALVTGNDVDDRERRWWPGTKSMTGNNIDDQCNRETFNDLPLEIIVIIIKNLVLNHWFGHTLPPTSSFTLAALETSGNISNSPCGSSIGEKEITLWINAHGKQDNLFVCYGVMGRGDLSIIYCTSTYIYFQNQLIKPIQLRM